MGLLVAAAADLTSGLACAGKPVVLPAESKFEFVYVVEVAVLEAGGGGCRATGIAFLGTVCATMFEYDMGLPGTGAAALTGSVATAAAGVTVVCFATGASTGLAAAGLAATLFTNLGCSPAGFAAGSFIFEGAARPATTPAAVIGGRGGCCVTAATGAATGVAVTVAAGVGAGAEVVCFDLRSFSCFLFKTFRAKSSCVACFLLFSFELLTELAGSGLLTVAAAVDGALLV